MLKFIKKEPNDTSFQLNMVFAIIYYVIGISCAFSALVRRDATIAYVGIAFIVVSIFDFIVAWIQSLYETNSIVEVSRFILQIITFIPNCIVYWTFRTIAMVYDYIKGKKKGDI